MVRRRRQRGVFHEPTLVPLADMLTNTVGIVVFILIFTALTAGGAMIAKRLPMEREIQVQTAQCYMCMDNRLFPLRDELIRRLVQRIGRPEHSLWGFQQFANQSNGITQSDTDIQLQINVAFEEMSNGARLNFSFLVSPLPEGGLSAAQIARGEGFLAEDLNRLDPKKSAVIFWVKPDALAVFAAATRTAGRRCCYSTKS